MSGAASTFARTSGQVPVTVSGPPARELQPIADGIEARVRRGNAQRLVIDVDRQRSRHAHPQRRKRQHTRAGPDVEHSVGQAVLHGFL